MELVFNFNTLYSITVQNVQNKIFFFARLQKLSNVCLQVTCYARFRHPRLYFSIMTTIDFLSAVHCIAHAVSPTGPTILTPGYRLRSLILCHSGNLLTCYALAILRVFDISGDAGIQPHFPVLLTLTSELSLFCMFH
jgi:hypothetical protein